VCFVPSLLVLANFRELRTGELRRTPLLETV
jgi:hypothetical protein